MLFGGNAGMEAPGARPDAAESEEVRLVGRIAEGDRRAFEMLYRRYFPRLARFLDRMLRNGPLIEEVINDTMLVVWQKARQFDRSSRVSTWIFAIGYRRALNALRQQDVPVESDADECMADAAQEPEEQLSRQQMQRIVGAAIDTLPVEQRAVVHLAYYHGLGYGEIADIMNCPVNTVKTRMFHVRRRLKLLLADRLEET